MLSRHFRIALLVLSALEACAAPRPSSDQTATVTEELRQRILDRKKATARGDSVAWIRAASLNPDAVCADAEGRLRKCRPDFGSPGEWQLRSSIDSFQVRVVSSIAIVTYRQTDTIQVGAEMAHSVFRYVETYRRSGANWELLVLSETPVPPPRTPVTGDTALYPLYTGTYSSAAYAFTVSRAGAHLTVAANGEKPDTLFALTATSYFAKGDPGDFAFVQTGSTPATELLYRISGQALHFRRLAR